MISQEVGRNKYRISDRSFGSNYAQLYAQLNDRAIGLDLCLGVIIKWPFIRSDRLVGFLIVLLGSVFFCFQNVIVRILFDEQAIGSMSGWQNWVYKGG